MNRGCPAVLSRQHERSAARAVRGVESGALCEQRFDLIMLALSRGFQEVFGWSGGQRRTPKQAFSGPLRRGDAATIRKHLEVLKQEPELLAVYRALARVGLRKLPAQNADELRRLIDF